MTDTTRPQNAPDFSAVIAQLYVYPVKSCAGVAVKEAYLTETGLDLDRAWMVVDENNAFLTQRELPRMALIQPQLRTDDIVLRAPGMLALHLAIDKVEAAVRASVWGQDVAAYDMGATAAQWVSDFLGVKARLVRFDPEHKRASSLSWTGGLEALNQFSDGYPLLVTSEASLKGLNDKLRVAGQEAVSMARFRPNIVLGDAPGIAKTNAMAAHDEDRLQQLQIVTAEGTVRLQPVKPCPRCPIVNIDPFSASSTPVVNDMLQTYRQDARLQGALSFGMNTITLDGVDQLLKVGQLVTAQYQFEGRDGASLGPA
ncbi:MAG: MOSC N-terminal beta barrel domain-containing protein [Polaromonas sp.]